MQKLEIPFWQATRDWQDYRADGVIIATPPATHFDIAETCLIRRTPVLIEKPVTLKAREAWTLVTLGGICFVGHTRLYSPAWRKFKKRHLNPVRVEGWAGGTDKDPWWDWGPHLVAMSMDLGCYKPVIHVTKEIQPLRLAVDGDHFTDVKDNPLDVLVGEFCAAITNGQPDNSGLRLGARVIEYLEKR